MKPSGMFPDGWPSLFVPQKRIAMGLDIATTEGQKSNPTALAITQEVGLDYFVRLVLRYKSSDPAVTTQAIEYAVAALKGFPLAGMAIDATSEKYFAAGLVKHFQGKLRVVPMVSSEALDYKGARMTYKAFLGNLLVNMLDDGRLAIPSDTWLEKDIRSVRRAKGSFEADVDKEGNHADCFDGIKLSVYMLAFGAGGPVEAVALQTGFQIGSKDERSFSRPDHSDDDKIDGTERVAI